jgi:flagellin FlaB
MYHKFAEALKNLHRRQRGMTGLETAIVLIAFVTVASVLAYSVLSAGIFSAERGKATVYSGLESAQSTLEIVGSVLGLSPNQSELETVQFTAALSVQDTRVDSSAIVVNYYDEEVHSENVTYTATKSDGSTERGSSSMIEVDEQFVFTVTIPTAATREAYEEFTLQVIPPTGSTLTITRTLPGYLDKVMDLQ